MNRAILIRVGIRAMSIWLLGLSLDNLGGLTCILLSRYSPDALYAVPKSALLLLGGILFFRFTGTIARWLEEPGSPVPDATLMRSWYQWCHSGCGVLLLVLYGPWVVFVLAGPPAGFTPETTPEQTSPGSTAEPESSEVSVASSDKADVNVNASIAVIDHSFHFTTHFCVETSPPAHLVVFIGVVRLLVLIRLVSWLFESRSATSGPDGVKDCAHAPL